MALINYGDIESLRSARTMARVANVLRDPNRLANIQLLPSGSSPTRDGGYYDEDWNYVQYQKFGVPITGTKPLR